MRWLRSTLDRMAARSPLIGTFYDRLHARNPELAQRIHNKSFREVLPQLNEEFGTGFDNDTSLAVALDTWLLEMRPREMA